MPAFKTAPGVQVKPSKRTKRSKPAEEPIFAEPELRTAAPDTSAYEPPPEPAHDTPTLTTDPSVEQAMEGSENPENPSLAKADDPDVKIIRTDFVEPGRPTALEVLRQRTSGTPQNPAGCVKYQVPSTFACKVLGTYFHEPPL